MNGQSNEMAVEGERPGDLERVLLPAISAARDLWHIVEAAQFARILTADGEPGTEIDRCRAEFEAVLDSCLEGWPDSEPATQVLMLDRFSDLLERFESAGNAVYANSIERTFVSEAEPIALPIAVIEIAGAGDGERIVDIPVSLEVDMED